MDLIQLYLSEVAKVSLLSAAEERELARVIEDSGRELRRATVASAAGRARFREWSASVERGELDVKDLLPHGRKSGAHLPGARLRLRGLAALFARAERAPASRRSRLLAAAAVRAETFALHEERVQELADLARAGDPRIAKLEERRLGAQARLVRANLRLVVSVARRYARHSMEMTDLVQEGALGLMRATLKYRPRKGFRFSTYATWWIRQSVQRAVTDQERTVRVPSHVQERAAKMGKVERVFLQEHGRVPTVDDYARRTGLASRLIKETLEAMQDPVSLAAPVGEDGESSLAETLRDTSAPASLAGLEGDSRRAEVDRWLSTLPPREAEVLKLRYGIGRVDELTLAEVGRRMRVSRERIRQIQAAAIARLKSSPLREAMRDF